MTRILGVAVAAVFVSAGSPPWVKLDDALAAAASTDKLVCVYATVPATGDRGDHGSPDADKALASKEVAERYGEFFWVKAADKATAKRIDAPEGGSHLVFVDPDGASVGAWGVQMGGEAVVLKALNEAKALYQPKPVPWFEGEPDPEDEQVRKKLIVYAFLDDKEVSEKVVKTLEHPWIARDHDRVLFVRKYVLDSPLAKQFKIASAPTLVFYDPTQKEAQREIERRKGEVTAKQVRAPMKKYFERRKKALSEGK